MKRKNFIDPQLIQNLNEALDRIDQKMSEISEDLDKLIDSKAAKLKSRMQDNYLYRN